MNTYVYEIHNNLYINLTNKCVNQCAFCVRKNPTYEGYDLWFDEEPSAEDILKLIKNPKKYTQIVFCGYGEPTMRFAELLRIGTALKGKDTDIRLDTNGLGNLINKRNICPQLAKAVDVVNISLNASNKEDYDKICKSSFGPSAFDEVLKFALECKKNKIKTVFSVVDVIGRGEVEKCRKIAQSLNIEMLVRGFIDNSDKSGKGADIVLNAGQGIVVNNKEQVTGNKEQTIDKK